MNEPDQPPAPAPVANDWGSRRHVHALVLIVATAAGVYASIRLAAPFIAALAWALALAVLFLPVHRWLERKVRRPNLAATITVVVASLIVLVVVAFVVQRLATEAIAGATAVRAQVESGQLMRDIAAHPTLAPLARWIETNTDVSASLSAIATWLTTKAASLVQGSVVQLVGLLLTFYFLFFFLRDRAAAVRTVRRLSPLAEADTDHLCVRIRDTLHAIFYGTLTVAAVQGTLGGLMFWWLGLAAPLLWGIMMGLLAVVPVLGASIIWGPAALFLAIQGSWGKAIVLAVWGAIVVGGIDNLLYPMLVGNRLKMHTAVAFISVVGGLMVFGAAGVILGPMVATATIFLLDVWHRRNAAALPRPASAPAAVGAAGSE